MKTVKRIFSAMISLCMITSVCSWTIPQAYAAGAFEGNGTAEAPYLISTKEDLVKLSDLMNSNETAAEYNNKYYKQTNDIDLENILFEPIGNWSEAASKCTFSGTYDGNYCELTSLYVDKEGRGGLFSLLTGTVKNLSVEGEINGTVETGGIAGNIHGANIINCSFNGSINSKGSRSGGIVGDIWRSGKIESCYFNGTINTNNPEANVGGIVGLATAGYEDNVQEINIKNCYASGFINADEKAHIGGIAGNIKTNNDASKVNLSNNYYLSSMAVGAVNNDNNKNCTKFAEKALKGCAENLGKPFTDNNRTDGFNDGYPVFEWQSEPYRFNGKGTESSPYIISNKSDLVAMRDMVNSAFFNSKYGSASYLLTSDIDLENEIWTPIGTYNDDGSGFKSIFSGNFNGNMHTIKNLKVDETVPYSGLFGRIGNSSNSGNVDSLNVYGEISSSSDYVGGLSGEIAYGSSITNSNFIGNVSGSNYVGGIAGKCWYSSEIINCYSNSTISAKSCAGGILGAALKAGDDRYNIKVENCYHIGDVSADSNAAQIIGASELNGNKSTTVELLNCYYLKGNEAVNGEYTKADVNPTSANLLKHIAKDLGSAFSSNTDTELNDGYPVLAWQTESKTIGDINNDGRIGIADAVLLQRHLLNCAPLSVNRGYAADINQDNIIDVFDMVLMRRLLIEQYKDYTEWSTETPPEGAVSIESRIEYRYASKTYKTSETKLDSPWVLEDTRTEYGDWGKWSDFSETKVEESDSRKVETKKEQRQTLSGYNMFNYCTRDAYTKERWYSNESIENSLAEHGADVGYGEHSTYLWGTGFVASQAELDSATKVYPGEWFTGSSRGINKGNVEGYHIASHPDILFFKGEAVYSNYEATLYRYCDRTKKNIYTYSQTGKYSDWSIVPVEASDDVVVETRTVYRYIPSN